MNPIIYLIYQFLPVIIALGFLLAAKSLSLINPKVQILTYPSEQLIDYYTTKHTKPYANPTILTMTREQLIITGKLPKEETKLYGHAAYNAAIFNYSNLDEIIPSLEKLRHKDLNVVITDRKIFLHSLSEFNPTTGILASYSLEQKLNIVN